MSREAREEENRRKGRVCAFDEVQLCASSSVQICHVVSVVIVVVVVVVIVVVIRTGGSRSRCFESG